MQPWWSWEIQSREPTERWKERTKSSEYSSDPTLASPDGDGGDEEDGGGGDDDDKIIVVNQ